MEQKFYSAPTGKETLGEFAYQILRRNETTGELEPMEFLFEKMKQQLKNWLRL